MLKILEKREILVHAEKEGARLNSALIGWRILVAQYNDPMEDPLLAQYLIVGGSLGSKRVRPPAHASHGSS